MYLLHVSFPQKPIIQYLKDFQLLCEEDRLPSYIPDSIFIQHYVSFRIALRRYAARVAVCNIVWCIHAGSGF